MSKKRITIISLSLALILLVSGITYAWYSWSSTTNTGVDFVIGSSVRIYFDGGPDIIGKELYPVVDYTDEEHAIKKTITSYLLDDSTNTTFNLKLRVNSIDANLKHSSFKWKLLKNGTEVKSGNFAGVSAGSTVSLITNQTASLNKDIYTLYIYIDGKLDNPLSMQNGTFDFKLYAEGENAELIEGPNPPKLTDGLIPVYYDETNSTWKKADGNNADGWYNYEEKKWANAVLVSDANRNTYINASSDTIINDSDILAFYVWIPRYKYKVWNINKVMGTDSYNAKTTGIDIVWENGTETTGTINCNYDFTVTDGSLSEKCTGSNGEYYTHPAFTFGADELTGFWMGKFEVSSENPSLTDGGSSSITLTPRIVPDVISWRNNSLSNQYKVIYDMQKASNIYGLSTNRTIVDSHMLKNIEWGAVTYLTHSKYGRCTDNVCTEVFLNNSTKYYTGRSVGSTNETNSIYGNYSYDGYLINTSIGEKTSTRDMSKVASTTGNIYGIYDMSGGSGEKTMGNISEVRGSYTYYPGSAGSNFTYNASTSKYIDIYALGTFLDTQNGAYNRGRLGDATSEIVLESEYGWYEDYIIIPIPDPVYGPWFTRGSTCYNGASVFESWGDNGSANTSDSSRATLAILK